MQLNKALVGQLNIGVQYPVSTCLIRLFAFKSCQTIRCSRQSTVMLLHNVLSSCLNAKKRPLIAGGEGWGF